MKFPSKNQSSSLNKNNQRNKHKKTTPNENKSQKPQSKNNRNTSQHKLTNEGVKNKKHTKNQSGNQYTHEEENQININHENIEQDQAFDASNNIKSSKKNNSKQRSEQNKKYDRLLEESGQGFKRQKNLYFLENQKYQGKKVASDEQEIQNQSNDELGQQYQSDEQNEEAEENLQIQEENEDYGQNDKFDQQSQEQINEDSQQNQNQIKKALSALKQKRQSTSKLLNEQISSINQEDKIHLKQLKKNKSKTTVQEIQQAVQLKKTLQVYDKLVQLRYSQQNELQQIKQYPKMDEELEEPKYPPMSHELFTANRELQTEMISNLSKYFKLYKSLSAKCKLNGKSTKSQQNNSDNQESQHSEAIQPIKQDEQTFDLENLIQADNQDNNVEDNLSSKRLNVDKIYQFIKKSISPQVSQVEKQLIKWSQKTSFISSNSSTSQLNSLLMQTPVGQAKKVLSNWERMAHKCQQKRGKQPFKILFEDDQNIHDLSDKQIYDDYDLFIELEKYYLEKLDDQNEDNEFLQSATMKYLKNKQANQLQHEKKQKQVDRKASKNRKIRFNVHTKLLNFMPSCPQNVIQTRDQIVRNMFNCNASSNEDAMQGNVSKYRAAQPHQERELIDVQ